MKRTLIVFLLVLAMVLQLVPFSALAAEEEQAGGDAEEGGDDEILRAEENKADRGDDKAADGGDMIFGIPPLVDDYGDEKYRHRKVNARGVEGDHRSHHR